MRDASEAVTEYLAAWSENDPLKRTLLLDRCWNPGGTIEIDKRRFDGRAGVETEIARFRRECPSDRARIVGNVEQVGRWFRFTAKAERADGSCYSPVLDFGELDQQGRILRIVTFVWTDERA